MVLLIGILGEGAGHLGHPVVPQPARAEIGLPGPLLDLPTDGALDRIWQYFSTDGFYKIPIGNSTFDMPAVDDLRGGMNGFPDRRASRSCATTASAPSCCTRRSPRACRPSTAA